MKIFLIFVSILLLIPISYSLPIYGIEEVDRINPILFFENYVSSYESFKFDSPEIQSEAKHLEIIVGISENYVTDIDKGLIKIPVEIKNTGIYPLENLTLDYNITGKYYLETDCERKIEIINPGNSYRCVLRFFPAKIGTYRISISVNGFVKKPDERVPENSSVNVFIDVRPKEEVSIIADPSFIIPIIILFLSMYLVIR